MPAFIQHLETALPETSYSQTLAGETMKSALSDNRLAQRLIGRVYRESGIEKRHSVLQEFGAGAEDGDFYDKASGTFKSPGTALRNNLYSEEAKKLYVEVGRRALENSPGLSAGDITHVVTVSCTGFFAPGPDFYVVKELCLKPSTKRFHLGFMGCYAAFPALKMAQAFCEADPDAVVLVICLELCTLHLQRSAEVDDIIAASVFADGAAAAVVSGKRPGGQALQMERFETAITPTGEDDMAWTIGDNGFKMVLSSYVPDIIEANIEGALEPLLSHATSPITHWGVHPGGRAILDKVQKSLNLTDEEMSYSRGVLRDYGNMSSATILFVLKEILEAQAQAPEGVCAMAFGPGLTVESGLFTKLPPCPSS